MNFFSRPGTSGQTLYTGHKWRELPVFDFRKSLRRPFFGGFTLGAGIVGSVVAVDLVYRHLILDDWEEQHRVEMLAKAEEAGQRAQHTFELLDLPLASRQRAEFFGGSPRP